MTEEEFMRLANTKKELELFIGTTKDEGFDAIGVRKIMFMADIHHYITDKELTRQIIDFLQTKLDEINKKIERL